MAGPLYTAESLFVQCAVAECGRGARAKGLCGRHYQRQRTNGTVSLLPRLKPTWATCSVEGCGKPSRTILGRFCEMHYGRMRRNGNHDAPVWGKWRMTEHGYIMKRDLEHPITTRTGYLYQHRAVLYDAIGPGVHQCHWCKAEIEWSAIGPRKLVVDHLDGNKTHNVPGNLVPSCHKCNATRGLFQRWVMDHRDDPFLWAMYEAAKRAA